MLAREVEFWRIGVKHMIKDTGENAILESFKAIFLQEYFPNRVIYYYKKMLDY